MELCQRSSLLKEHVKAAHLVTFLEPGGKERDFVRCNIVSC